MNGQRLHLHMYQWYDLLNLTNRYWTWKEGRKEKKVRLLWELSFPRITEQRSPFYTLFLHCAISTSPSWDGVYVPFSWIWEVLALQWNQCWVITSFTLTPASLSQDLHLGSTELMGKRSRGPEATTSRGEKEMPRSPQCPSHNDEPVKQHSEKAPMCITFIDFHDVNGLTVIYFKQPKV